MQMMNPPVPAKPIYDDCTAQEVEHMSLGEKKERYARMLFAAFDIDGNGFLEEEELAAMISMVKGPKYLMECNLKKLIKQYDKNFDGRMSFVEVHGWLLELIDGKTM
jgi:Ca2+-binding EF-hand superfamily protein